MILQFTKLKDALILSEKSQINICAIIELCMFPAGVINSLLLITTRQTVYKREDHENEAHDQK